MPGSPSFASGRRLVGGLFFASGFASLLYQVAWQRLLAACYGVGPVSSALIVGIYMLGLGLGAYAGGHLADRTRRPLHWYAGIEAAVAAFGATSLVLVHRIGAATAGAPYAISASAIALFLLVPTFLMGTTLPLITRYLAEHARSMLGALSFLYAINTLGAAVGAVIGAYVILSFFGLVGATRIAVAINIALAAGALWLGRLGAAAVASDDPAQPSTFEAADSDGSDETMGRVAYAAAFVSGWVSMAYEMVALRVVSMLSKDSPYAFATVLFVFLLAIGLGSYLGGWAVQRWNLRRRSLFLLCQVLAGASIAFVILAFLALARHTPFSVLVERSFVTELHPSAGATAFGAVYYRIDSFLWSAFFLLAPGVFFGASFPLVASLAGGRGARRVGAIYLANVAGTLAGTLATVFWCLPSFGTERTLLGLVALCLLYGPWLAPLTSRPVRTTGRIRAVATAGALALIALMWPRPEGLYDSLMINPLPGAARHFLEGPDAVSVVYERGEEVANFIGGAGHGARPGPMFAVEANEALSFTRGHRVLVIGIGTATMLEGVLADPRNFDVTLVELSATVLQNLRHIPAIARALASPRLRTVVDDGRRFLQRTDERFDLILIDPLRTTTSASNNLYCLEFDRLVHDHLAPSGVFLQWTDESKMVPRTFARVFEVVRFYRYVGQNWFLLGSKAPFERQRPSAIEVVQSVYHDAVEPELLGDRAMVLTTTDGAGVLTDDEPSAEYFLGRRAHGSP